MDTSQSSITASNEKTCTHVACASRVLVIIPLTLERWHSNNYMSGGAGSNRPRQVLAYISVTTHITNLMLLPILTKIWSRNLMVAFSTLAKIYFSRWRPIWPPNHTKSYISAHKHDRETNFVSINM